MCIRDRHYTGADSFVRNGAYATCGVNYTDLGTRTADLALKAMAEGMSGMEDYYLLDGGIITVNTDTAAMIGTQAEHSCFDSMGTVVEVTTTKDLSLIHILQSNSAILLSSGC